MKRTAGVTISLIMFMALALEVQSTAARGYKVGTVLYQADRTHGWAGWKARGWTIHRGNLVSNGTAGEIRVPYVPGQHGVADYRLEVRMRELGADDGALGLRVRRVNATGYSLLLCCGAAESLTLHALHQHKFLAATDADGTDSMMSLTYTLSAQSDFLDGTIDENGARVSVSDSRYRSGGFAAIYVDDGTRILVTRVRIISQ